MFLQFARARRCAVAGLSLILGSLIGSAAFAESEPQASAAELAATAQVAVRAGNLEAVAPGRFDGDVRDLPAVTYGTPRYWHLWNDFEEPHRVANPASAARTPQVAPEAPLAVAAMPATSANFAGLGFSDSVSGGSAGAGWPPDINGDVGPTVYVQSVNDAFAIFNKSTGARLAAFTEDQLWNSAGTGTACHGLNEGDPVVLHDGLADRWILTDFAFDFDSSGSPIAPYYECIAVSQTADPVSGGWFFYAVRIDTGSVPSGTLGDYPKFGLWTDCLYMGANGFDANGNFNGALFAAFNRSSLFAGQALTSSNSSLGFLSGNSAPFSMFPANLLGTGAAAQPPSGTPEYFVDEGISGTGANVWEVRKFTHNGSCGAGQLGAAVNVSQAQYGYPANIPNSTTFDTNIVQQRSTSNTLDSLGDRVMQKVQYRKVGTAESLWLVHSTCGASANSFGGCVSGAKVTPQWTQINVTNKTVSTTPVQQQIYAPDTTQHRWMGSLAVDNQGNMALGYSLSSSTTYPSIAYSGRLATDALNQLPQTESILQAGGGSQINTPSGSSVQRWGDYSSMSIDPSDDCTFWYTNEYYDTVAHGSNSNWQTRVGAFKFPGCGVIVGTKLVVTQQPNASYASGASITVKVSIEDANGNVATGDTSAVTLTLSGGTVGATLGGSKTVNAVAGVATFSNLTVDKVGSGYTLNATDGSFTAAASTALAITAGTATQILWNTQPVTNSNVAAGANIPLVAHVRDAANNGVPNQVVTLSFGANPGNSTLSVTTNPVMTDASGNATFAGVSLNKAGQSYSLFATNNTQPMNAQTNAFNIVAGAPNTLAFTTQPAAGSNVVAGATIPLSVRVTDTNGNPIANQSIGIALAANPGSANLSVQTSPLNSDANGNVTFAGVSLNKSGSGYTIKATDNGVSGLNVTGAAFNIVAGAPAQLVFQQQPGGGVAGVALNPPVTLSVLDALNNVVTSDTHSVTLNVAGGPGGFDPISTVTATFSNGVATFGNLVFRNAGTGYTLGASDAGDSLTSAPSASFAIVAGAPRLVFTTEPANVSRGGALATIAVTEVDGTGAAVTADSTSSVDFTIAACGGSIDLGSATMVNGVATLNSPLVFFNLASGRSIQASSGVLSGNSAGFDVVASELVFDDGFEGCRL